MKIHQLIIISSLVASCMMASCKKEDGGNANAIIFTASTEGQNADNDRTSIVADDNEDEDVPGTVIWTAGDRILINNGSMSSTLGLIAGADTDEGTFRTNQMDQYFELTENYVAAYPSSATINGNTVTFNLPSVQDMGNRVGTFANGANPMVAKSEGTVLHFKNVCGGLGVRLKGGMEGIKVTNIRIISKKVEDVLWGAFPVTINANTKKNEAPDLTLGAVTNSDTDKNIIDLKCDVTLSTTQTSRFFIILPVGTLAEGFNLEVTYTVNGMVGCIGESGILKKTTGTITSVNTPEVVRNTMKCLPVLTITKNQFTIDNDGNKVYFSKGNLQYIGSAGNGNASNSGAYWKFADHQWDCLGDNGQGSSEKNVDRDLFGWGTSGWNNGNIYYHPWDYNRDQNEDIGYGYGPKKVLGDEISYNNDLTGDYANADWGVYNAIKNGGNAAGQWRTLTKDEWTYVINRENLSVMGFVDGISGIILLPDNWLESNDPLGSDATNVSIDDWTDLLEAKGAVFLPGAGFRDGTTVDDTNVNCYYWSATNNGNGKAYIVSGTSIEGQNRNLGYAVRLVKDVQ